MMCVCRILIDYLLITYLLTYLLTYYMQQTPIRSLVLIQCLLRGEEGGHRYFVPNLLAARLGA